jgi:hypothetical protein
MYSAAAEPILAGRLSGKRAFLQTLEQLPEISAPTLVLLDFDRIELATSSFLSEAIFPLRDHLRLRRFPGYVVVANLCENVREEIEELVRRVGDAVLTCALDRDGNISDVQLCGRLDQKLQETLDLVNSKGVTTAVELHAASHSDSVGVTAWNNRLTVLSAKSLVVEEQQGRTKKYRPVLEIA